MRSAVVREAGKPLEIEDRPVPEPGPGQVRVEIHACGICHSDRFVAEALWPELKLPRVPGHEVAGLVDAVGEGVRGVEKGQRVGVGWYGGHCGACGACRVGDFVLCENGGITGITHDGGYAEYMIAPAESLALVPDRLSMIEAAPLLCAGITTYNALRNSGARPGDLVAVQGLGGLGHLGVQFAKAQGCRVVVLSRGADKAEFAHKLGAQEFVDTGSTNAVEALQKMGGAKVILATAPSAKAISDVVPGLGRDGSLVVVAAPFEPIQVNPIDLISARRKVVGWPSGHAQDATDTLAFAAQAGIRPMIETFPLREANAAYRQMLEGRPRFRVVLDAHS